MKDLYVIEVQEEETEPNSVYFTRMTSREAKEMSDLLEETGLNYKLHKVEEDPGFNDFDSLMKTFEDHLSGDEDGERPSRRNPGELTDKKARALIKQGLRDREWTPDFAETVVDSIEQIDGIWTYGVSRSVQDLAEIYKELEAEHGEPPDGRV